MEILLFLIPLVWAVIWIRTYTPNKIGGFIRHTAVFILLSFLLLWLALYAVFGRVDESYSASNIGALGLLFMLWFRFFIAGCLISLLATTAELLDKRKSESQSRSKDSLESAQT